MSREEKDHGCAKSNLCGRSIKNFYIEDGKEKNPQIVFWDANGHIVAQIPKLPEYSGNQYENKLYKDASSKEFNTSPKDIDAVLPNSFNVNHGYINCTIKHDNLSEQEKNQIKLDIKSAYEVFKEKFCLKDNIVDRNLTVYIFNNRKDYEKYNDLLGLNHDGGLGYITRGVTNCKKVLTYKQDAMDFVLAHELGHVFQWCFSPAAKVCDLHGKDTEFIANFVGREVEEKNRIHSGVWLKKQ